MMLPILLLVTAVSATEFHYKLHESNDAVINECVQKAMDEIMRETCIYYEEDDERNDHITFLQSGHCSWQAANKTVHLSPNCITDDTCFEILGKVADVHQPKQHVSRHMNLKFNCTEKCTNECENGGTVNDDCSCSCAYGFSGERCSELTRKSSFNDHTCGIINAEEQGHIALSTYPAEYNNAVFCQWFIKSDNPWDVIEIEFDEFDLDNDDMPPGQHCNDLFNVFGAGTENPIRCDAGKPSKIRSTSNWILLELRSNPWPVRKHKGPSIRYTKVQVPQGIKVFSEEMTSSASLLSAFTALAVCALRFL